MRQEDKELLFADLSARLPYGVIISVKDINDFQFDGILQVLGQNWCRLNILDPIKKAKVKNQTIPLNHIYIKPYLRPMSSMTEDELQRYHELCDIDEEVGVGSSIEIIATHDTPKSLDYLNSIHVDYRGLIPKGLAISTEEFNPYND